MASSSHDSASLPQPGSESVEDIQDALEIHKILLDSLENTSEDTPAKRAEFKAMIESCEKKLLEAESAVPKSTYLFICPTALLISLSTLIFFCIISV